MHAALCDGPRPHATQPGSCPRRVGDVAQSRPKLPLPKALLLRSAPRPHPKNATLIKSCDPSNLSMRGAPFGGPAHRSEGLTSHSSGGHAEVQGVHAEVRSRREQLRPPHGCGWLLTSRRLVPFDPKVAPWVLAGAEGGLPRAPQPRAAKAPAPGGTAHAAFCSCLAVQASPDRPARSWGGSTP